MKMTEREALARILEESDPETGGVIADEGHEPWEWYLPQADAILAAGYSRVCQDGEPAPSRMRRSDQ